LVVSVVGLGLMGGSFALALKKVNPQYRITGYDSNREHIEVAVELGIIDSAIDFTACTNADVLILAVPVESCVSILASLAPINPNITIIDLGSTKEKISSACPVGLRKNLVAAHPMTGTEYSGPKAASANLYRDKTVVLCDLEKSGEEQVATAKKLFLQLDMNIVEMSSNVHDLHAAFISHLPHLISFSIANTVLGQEDTKNILMLAAGGFKDMSRLAKSSPAMWRDIFIQNRQNLLECIGFFKEELEKFEIAIDSSDETALSKLMESANGLHNIFK